MLNIIWISLIIGAIAIGIFNGATSAVVESITYSAQQAITIALGLIGILTLWLGIMRIAEEAGLIRFISRLLSPLMRFLFPTVPHSHPAMGAVTLNIAANMLGMGNAATPFGLRAMEELNKLNRYPGTATNAMCMLLALNTSSVQLIPTTAIAILAANGDVNPTSIIFPVFLATICSTLVAISIAKLFEKFPRFYRLKNECELAEPK
jgi:spore maturation protein A